MRTELSLHPRNQFPDEKGLHHVIVCAQLEPDNPVGFGSARRQKYDRDGGQIRMAPDGFADIEAVRIRQHDVQDDQIGALPAAEFHGALPGLDAGNRKALPLQVVLQESEQIDVIFNHNNFLHMDCLNCCSRGIGTR